MVPAWNLLGAATAVFIVAAYGDKAPIIFPSDGEIIYQRGEDIKLQCSSDVPIHWTFPYAPNIFINYTTYDGMFHGILFVPSASYSHTGYYNCTTTDPGPSSSVYLFVSDKDRLLRSKDLSVIMASPGDDVLFPCVPTSPGVRVKLLRYSGDTKRELDVNFDNTAGFTLRDVNIFNRGLYECKAELDDVTYSSKIMLSVLPFTDSVPKPKINATEDFHVNVGSNITLLCSVEAELGSMVWLSWKVPNQLREMYFQKGDRIVMGRTMRIMSQDMESEKASSLLTINHVTPHDEGDYQCQVKDHNKRRNYNKVHITVDDVVASYDNEIIAS